MSDRASEIIALRDGEKAKQENFRSLWQETADLVFPRENQITALHEAGRNKYEEIYDNTAILDSQDMASGLSSALIPSGQKFFGLLAKDRSISDDEDIKRYLTVVTEICHEELFESNFMLQLNETLRSLVVFGTGNLYSEWDGNNGKLNYKDFDISLYQILEDNHGNVDTVTITFQYTARQAVQAFGEDNVGKSVLKAYKDPKDVNEPFEFIHYVGPRKDRISSLRDSGNMPWESIYVGVKDKIEIEQGGFEEFPFAVPRWMKSSHELYGRGQGTEALADIKVLQQIMRDFILCANKHNRPALIVHSSFEGIPDNRPDGLNYVQDMANIKGMPQTALGNFVVTSDALQFQQEKIHKAFFRDIFVQLSDLKGDRRTTVEIMERIREGLRRLALPVARMQSELFNPLITRSIMLLMRNGRLPQPPADFDFAIEYQGELALALRNQQAKGALQWFGVGGELEQLFPGITDNISADAAFRRLGESYGVHSEDMSTEDEVAEKRLARQQQQQAQQAMQVAEMAAEGYNKTSGAPEEGSPAGKIMEGAGAA